MSTNKKSSDRQIRSLSGLWKFGAVLSALLISGSGFSSSVPTRWEGDVFSHQSFLFLQARGENGSPADRYFWMPTRYRLTETMEEGADDGGWFGRGSELRQSYSHSIEGQGEHRESVYRINLKSRRLSHEDEYILSRQFSTRGRRVNIDGQVQTCGYDVLFPENSGQSGAPALSSGSRPRTIRLGIPLHSNARCSSASAPRSIQVELRVPMEQEPAVARALTSQEGMMMPAVRVRHPMRFTATGSISVNQRDFLERVKNVAGFGGTFSIVTASARITLKNVIRRLSNDSRVRINIPTDDPNVRQEFLRLLESILVDKILDRFLVRAGTLPGGGSGPNRRRSPSRAAMVARTENISTNSTEMAAPAEGANPTSSSGGADTGGSGQTREVGAPGAADGQAGSQQGQPPAQGNEGRSRGSVQAPESDSGTKLEGVNGETNSGSITLNFEHERETIRDDATFEASLQDEHYSTITSDLELRVQNLRIRQLSPEIREMLQRARGSGVN